MPPVFGHGRLRLYLLKLLAESPRHGYEVIRLLEERFQGLYAPSAGTVYPRLAKLASEGLVSHTEEGGRKVYSLTPEGERELAGRTEELTALERELRDSLSALAAGLREEVSDSVRELRSEVGRAGAEEFAAGGRRSRPGRAGAGATTGAEEARATPEGRESEAPSGAEWPGQVGQEHFERAARRIQERVRSRATAGDWPGAVRAGLDGLSAEFSGWKSPGEPRATWAPAGGWSAGTPGAEDASPEGGEEAVADPARELERLLDRFRDDVRDAARDHGVSQEQLREARHQLSIASAHLAALLRSPHG
ncbi:DNA-binding transcriptional regulator, PadR family [Streptomyces zhaozhouensis]|uniref:DNA-binding transcriptional regulator, PadR family n=1 Tax=Streptomyces zhaozhouensis TaxID=1300267 RepID=A0A286DQ53_9ACTN|nr:PadR family transcriptional regulator [Streptomyces zhaozhouensis]SOD60795.1 DNA-binding transcriptional regulator, PadR family [Streptomyces zhaozhouensis]